MIRYSVSVRSMLSEIKAHGAQHWLARARSRTAEFYRQGGYFEDDGAFKPFWSELTPLYLRLQKYKCIYCERTLGDVVYGRVEMNVEHYRPKQRVDTWPSAYLRKHYPHLAHYQRVRGDNLTRGYWPLAYHPLNLAVSCRRCNLRVKKSFFPINASRITAAERNLRTYDSELPDLFYPFSTIDPDDPEVCIAFQGPLAFPAVTVSVRAQERARVTIDLLHLNQRSELISERCRVLCTVYVNFILSRLPDAARQNEGQMGLDNATADTAPHANCARCFLRLCQEDIETARMFFFEATKRIASPS